MKWLHPIADVRAWIRWRENVLIDYEDACFRAARDRAATDEECAFWDVIIAMRAENRRNCYRL